jgi:hypothetical protein
VSPRHRTKHAKPVSFGDFNHHVCRLVQCRSRTGGLGGIVRSRATRSTDGSGKCSCGLELVD